MSCNEGETSHESRLPRVLCMVTTSLCNQAPGSLALLPDPNLWQGPCHISVFHTKFYLGYLGSMQPHFSGDV